jgi:hypothetical protein
LWTCNEKLKDEQKLLFILQHDLRCATMLWSYVQPFASTDVVLSALL